MNHSLVTPVTKWCGPHHGEVEGQCGKLVFVTDSIRSPLMADAPGDTPMAQPTSAGPRVRMKNMLYATDLSQASKRALPFALAVARAIGAKVYALHVATPPMDDFTAIEVSYSSLEAVEETIEAEKARLEAQLCGVPHEIQIERGPSVWAAMEQAIHLHKIDLVVLGTHGRTGAEKLLFGSTVEGILRQCPVPVMTIGPGVRSGSHVVGHIRRLLFATDLSEDSARAARFAVALAEQNRAELKLMHVIQDYRPARGHGKQLVSAAHVLHELHELMPKECELLCRPELILEYGVPSERILAVAEDKGADLIVIGARQSRGSLLSATHLEGNTAHQVLVRSRLPVVTVLGSDRRGPAK